MALHTYQIKLQGGVEKTSPYLLTKYELYSGPSRPTLTGTWSLKAEIFTGDDGLYNKLEEWIQQFKTKLHFWIDPIEGINLVENRPSYIGTMNLQTSEIYFDYYSSALHIEGELVSEPRKILKV